MALACECELQTFCLYLVAQITAESAPPLPSSLFQVRAASFIAVLTDEC